MNQTESITEQAAQEAISHLFPEGVTSHVSRFTSHLLAEGKSYGTRRAFSDEKQTLMNTLVNLVGSLKGNLDQKLIKDSEKAFDDLKDEFKDALFGLLKSYQDGEITADVFKKQMQDEIRRAWGEAYEAGVGAVGSPFGVYDEDETFLKGARKEEFGYLKGFVDDMEDDVGVMDYENRLQMYVDTLDGAYNNGKVEASPDNVEIWWELDPAAQNCFPKGTMISTPTGEKVIESISIGDLVDTLKGPRKVTRLYSRDYREDLYSIHAGDKNVSCTPNHPFLTKSGWVRADYLKKSDEVVCLENGLNLVYRKIGFPDPNDLVSAGGKVGILRSISTLLGKLPFRNRIESGVPMPVIPVHLNDDFSDSKINNEFWFDKSIGFEGNTKIRKDATESNLWFRWITSLKFLMTGKESCLNAGGFFGMIFRPCLHFFDGFGFFHWIIHDHIGLSLRMNKAISGFLGKVQPELTCLALDLGKRSSQCFSNHLSTFIRIMRGKVFNFIRSPSHYFFSVSFYLYVLVDLAIWFPSALKASDNFFPILHPSTDGTWPSLFSSLTFRKNDISASNGAIILGSIPSPSLGEVFPTVFANIVSGCRPGNRYLFTFTRTKLKADSGGPFSGKGFIATLTNKFGSKYFWMGNIFTHLRKLFYQRKDQTVKVFNLEVDDVHHYIANGFVVHNCDDCIERADPNNNPYDKDTLPGVPGDGSCQCLCITTPSSRVLTDRGWVPIVDVVSGDLVLTHKGRWKSVLATSRNPSNPSHRQAWILGMNDQLVGCTSDHRFLTERGWENVANINQYGLSVSSIECESKPEVRLVWSAGRIIVAQGVLPEGTTLYDLTVEDDHSFIIEGLVTHNSNCRCSLRMVQTGELPEPGLGFVRAVEPKGPRIPSGMRLPTFQEYEKISALQAEIDRINGLIDATTGKVKAGFIDDYRNLVHQRVAAMGSDIYYVQKSNYYQGGENPFLRESLDENRMSIIPDGYRSPSDKEKARIDSLLLDVNDLRHQIASGANGYTKDLIERRHRLTEQVIDFMERHKIYYLPEAFISSVSPDPGKALVEELARGIVNGLFMDSYDKSKR